MAIEHKKQEVTKKKQKRTRKTRKIICQTREEAKNKVSELVNKGENYRNIAQIEFVINGSSKHFSILEICKIKDDKTKISSEKNAGDIASKVFKLFEQGKQPTQIVIDLKLSPDRVKELYNTYLELKGINTDFLKQKQVIAQLVRIRDYFLTIIDKRLKLPNEVRCFFCNGNLLYIETDTGHQGFACKKCNVFLKYGELLPQPLPKDIDVSLDLSLGN
jgi:hypothetical protein